MKHLNLLFCLGLIAAWCSTVQAEPRNRPGWEPRWLVEVSGNVFSPGGVDKDRYSTSLGAGLSLIYWINWDTQLLVSGALTSLKTNEYYWLPFDPADTTITISQLEVKGRARIFSVEARKLFPSDRQNYLYLGLGLDYFSFGTVKGSYYIQQSYTNPPVPAHTESFSKQRDPTWAAGVHISPGLFFLLYPRIPVDIAIRAHLLYDGKNSIGWIEPTFGIGYRFK
jgi:hypothetical protein